MRPQPLKLAARTKELFCISQFKFFCQGCDYVACFGEPAAASDGWILNLPAAHVFEGDYYKLPSETLLDATWVHAQAVVRDPLSRYLSHNAKSMPWAARAADAGVPKYQPADLFRDLATFFSHSSQFSLALDFIKRAHELRPQGPVIARMLAELNFKCQPGQHNGT